MTAIVHRQLGLTDDEYDRICGLIDRPPEPAELAMFSVMWSEHCSYKSSRAFLSELPTEAPWVVVGPGENAGVVDIGDGWLAAIRIESHNHPSFVEPYQGAATGVGGILRDVFTMGARPVGLWNQIRFGDPADAHNRYLLNGVVAGIAGYGNAVGVPTLGGEIEFDAAYTGNPLVNVMCLGIMRREQLVLGTAGPPRTVAVLLGAATGRDGIGGASVLASASFDETASTKRPAVQVGDPFEEKKLIEACLELYERDLVVGVQDLGAAGLSCAASEPAARAGAGLELDLDAVHLREDGMTAPELLMSESQERMMAFVAPELVNEVLAVAAKWEISASVVGRVTDGARLRVRHAGEFVADLDATALTDGAPLLMRTAAPPAELDELWSQQAAATAPVDEALWQLLGDPALANPAPVYEQFDHMLFLNTVNPPGRDGSLIRIQGTTKGLAVSSDGDGRLCHLDPRRGAERLVFEAAMNVAVHGARPLAVVDNLNLGNPEKPEVMWQLVEIIAGLKAGCEALGVPVVGGNVSLYNETDGRDILPTPVVGMLGVVDPIPPRPKPLATGHRIGVIGKPPGNNMAGSAYQRVIEGNLGGRPTAADRQVGVRAVAAARAIAHEIPDALLHDVANGGLLLALTETLARASIGAHITGMDAAAAFNEDPHRFIVFVPGDQAGAVESAVAVHGFEPVWIGTVGGDALAIQDIGPLPIEDLRQKWNRGLATVMEGAPS